VHTAPGKAPALVDKQVVHDATEPGTRLVDIDEVVELAEGLNKEFLKQVFGLGLLAA